MTQHTVLAKAMTVLDPVCFLCGWLFNQGTHAMVVTLWSCLWWLLAWWVCCCGDAMACRVGTTARSASTLIHLFACGWYTIVCRCSCGLLCKWRWLAAVTYYQWDDKFNHVVVKFVCAKVRLLSVKRLTIPQLELQAAAFDMTSSLCTVREQTDQFVDMTASLCTVREPIDQFVVVWVL